MFTGLIQGTGTIVSVVAPAAAAGPTRITISSPKLAPELHTGDSIAVSGVCLTALDITLTQFSADLARETVERTTLAGLGAGSLVNLELPTPAGTPLGGHVVQGHVDGVATLVSLEPLDPANEERSDWRLKLAIPSDLAHYVVPQGSITVEGISLTVAELRGDVVSIAIIPHTYGATTLRSMTQGSRMNVEVDVLGKYAEARTAHRRATDWTLTEGYLLNNGY